MSLALFTVLFKRSGLIVKAACYGILFCHEQSRSGEKPECLRILTNTAMKMQKHSQKRQLTDCLSVIHGSSLFLVQCFGHELKNKGKDTNTTVN